MNLWGNPDAGEPWHRKKSLTVNGQHHAKHLMSSQYARAISILRQASIVLSEQMTSVDLYALRSDTIGGEKNDISSILDKTLHDLQATVPVAKVTETWTAILASVSVPLVKFAQEMARVESDINAQMDMLRNTLRLLWIMQTVVIIGLLIFLVHVLSFIALHVDPANAVATAGVLIVALLAITSGFRIWAAHTNEQYAEFRHHLNNALVTTLLGYVNSLPATQAVVVMYAIITGGNVSAEIARFNNSKYAIALASQCSPSVSGSVNTAGMTEDCEKIPTMITMPRWIAENVKVSTLLTIADALIDLKELGVDRFDRAPLWANVRAGVDAVRSLCMVAYDDENPARNITRDVIVSAIRNEIAPILCVPGVELPKGAFGPTSASISPGTTKITGMTLLNPSYSSASITSPSSHGHKISISQCTRAIIDSGGEYKFGYYDTSNSLCYACGDVKVASTSFTSNASTMAASASNSQLIIARPHALDLSGSPGNPVRDSIVSFEQKWSDNVDAPRVTNTRSNDAKDAAIIQAVAGAVGTGVETALKKVIEDSAPDAPAPAATSSTSSTPSGPPTQSVLYLSALSMPWAMAATILDQSEELQRRIIVVLKRYRWAIDLDTNRNLIDQALISFYGSSTYASGGISSAVDTVLSDLKSSVIKYRQRGDPSSPYIDVDRMMSKISAMSNDTTNSLSNTFQTLTDATTSYTNLYAPFKPGFPAKLSNILSIYGGGILFAGYATYVALLRTQLLKKVIGMGPLSQRISIATCLLTVCLFVSETMLAQYGLKSSHNWIASNDNSMMLIGATVRINNEFVSLLQTIQSWGESVGGGTGGGTGDSPSPYNAPRAAAIAFLADCKGVVEKFDACNTITAQQSTLPLPLTEILLYSVVGGGVLIFAALCVNSVVPSERIQSIGVINRLIDRITDGDSSAIVEAKSIIECARVPINLENLASWLGIIIFAWLTVWFASQSVQALRKYKNSLDASSDCR